MRNAAEIHQLTNESELSGARSRSKHTQRGRGGAYLHIVLHDVLDGAHLVDDVGAHQLHGGLAFEGGDRVVKFQIERVDLPRHRRLLLLSLLLPDVSGGGGGGGGGIATHLCNQPQRRWWCPGNRRRCRRGVLQEAGHGQLLAGAASSRHAPQKRHRFRRAAAKGRPT